MSDEQKRILIMEDSDIFADMLIGFLNSYNYVVERAVNGFEGIKKTYSFLPHLIVTDIEMPVFKGYQVTRFLKTRKNLKPIPIIMFTSLDEHKDKFWGSQAGADIYIEKSPDNLHFLGKHIEDILSKPQDIDFSAIERESRKINDVSIIETVNNLLDSKLFQTTIIGMLNEISCKVHSMEMVAKGILDLLYTICEAEIATLMIRGSNRILYIYTVNYGEFTKEIADNFSGISTSDFNKLFPDFKPLTKKPVNFRVMHDKKDTLAAVPKEYSQPPSCTNNQKITSYISVPLTIAGENFASLHIANTINEYFTPAIMENVSVFIGAASPVIANALSMHELAELQKNTRIAFARYIPADVMDEIINETNKKTFMSENKKISVLFCDIRDFTTMSENLDAQTVVDFLNSYFAKMGREVISEGGHIDKFIGDAIMAVFGAVQNLENSPVNSIRSALKMFYALEMINSGGNKLTKEKIKIGVGINCGECILGNIGFQNKMDYTIIGDTVNLASRIEGLTKVYRYPLIVSEYVYEQAKEKFLMRKIDNVRVKGKDNPVGIYAVYSGFYEDGSKQRAGEINDLPSVKSLKVNHDTLVNYHKGLQVFYMREWKLAHEYFKKSLETDSNDPFSLLYLKRSLKFIDMEPGDNWDGVITLDRK